MIALAVLSHRRTLQGSSVLTVWLIATIAGDIARTRTAWLNTNRAGLFVDSLKSAVLLSASLQVKFALLVLVSLSTRQGLRPEIRAVQVRRLRVDHV